MEEDDNLKDAQLEFIFKWVEFQIQAYVVQECAVAWVKLSFIEDLATFKVLMPRTTTPTVLP